MASDLNDAIQKLQVEFPALEAETIEDILKAQGGNLKSAAEVLKDFASEDEDEDRKCPRASIQTSRSCQAASRSAFRSVQLEDDQAGREFRLSPRAIAPKKLKSDHLHRATMWNHLRGHFDCHIRDHIRRLVNWSRCADGSSISSGESEGNVLRLREFILVNSNSASALRNRLLQQISPSLAELLPECLRRCCGSSSCVHESACVSSCGMVAFAAVRLVATPSFFQCTSVCRRGMKSIAARVYGRSYRRAVEESVILMNAVERNKERGSFFRGKSNILHAANIRGQCDIIDAVKAHDAALVQDFLWDNAACVNISEEDSCTALHVAAQIGNPDITRLLLEGKASVNAVMKKKTIEESMSPLMVALGGHLNHDRLEVVHLLLAAGAHLERNGNWLFSLQNFSSLRIGHFEMEVVSLLLNAKADVMSASDGNGMSFLHHAAAVGHCTTARALLDANMDVNVKDKFGRSPLHFFGSLVVTKLLISARADIDGRDSRSTAPLHEASMHGYLPAVRLLLDQGADVNSKDWNGRSPLCFAIGHMEVAQLLVDAKADVNIRDRDGRCLLLDAATRGHLSAVQMLVAARADLGICSKLGSSALHQAAMNGHLSVVQMLVAANSDVNIQCSLGKTALRLAVDEQHNSVVEYLASVGGRY